MKNKPLTNSQRAAKYNKEHYAWLSALLPKDLLNRFNEHCKSLGIVKRKVIIGMIENYLDSHK